MMSNIQNNQPLKLKCLHKYRDKNSNIIGYGLIDIQGKPYKISSNDLKQAIKQGRVQVVNLTLTADNRLVDGATEKYSVIREPHNQGGKIQVPIKQNQKSNQPSRPVQVEKKQDPKQRLVYQSTDPQDQVKRIKQVIIEIIKRYMGNNYTIILDRRYNTVNFHSEDIADLKLIGPNGQKLQDNDKQQLAKFNMLYKNFIELQFKVNKQRGTFKLTSVISELAKKEKQRGYVIGYVYGNKLQIIGRDKDIVTRAYAKAITTKFNKEASNPSNREDIDKSSQDILKEVLREASGESIMPPESSEDIIRKQWINHKLFMTILKADTSEAIKQRKEQDDFRNKIKIKRRKQEESEEDYEDNDEEDIDESEEDIDDEE